MATFTVTNLFDSGSGSLRNAIFRANTASTTDDIAFDTALSGSTINLTSRELRIRDDLTINGLGADFLSVDAGGNPFRVFNVDDADENSDLEVAINGLTITGGNVPSDDFFPFEGDDGGGIRNSENLTVSNSTISGNEASYSGGGIDNLGDLTVSNSTISGNTAEFSGGGIDSNGDLTVSNSTISGNSAGTNGGGIDGYGGGTLTVSNSTISGNTAEFSGGGIDSNGDLTVSNSTISGNSADRNGGGIDNFGDLTVSNSTISGNSAEDGGGIFHSGYYSGAIVTNSTISGNSADLGGGIRNVDSLTVTDSTISDNTAEYGGGIRNDGNLTLTNSTISSNSTDSSGGGINNLGDLTVSNSTISGNSAEGSGGGIDNLFANLTVSNSTISSNSADREGGGIYSFGSDLTVSNSTISGNSAEDGGGISNDFSEYNGNVYGTATVTSSVIAANTDNQDIDGEPLTSGGNNLIGNGDGAEGFTNGVNDDLVGTTSNPIDPLLGELQNNGGPTQTQALLTGSPAINAGSNPEGLRFDQRGPGFNRVIGAQTDIGAVEVVPEPDSTLGVLGVAILGVVLLRKRQRRRNA